MSTPQKIGGYVHHENVARVRAANTTARRYVERLLDETPGPALTAMYLARVGLALGEISDATGELERIGRQDPDQPKDGTDEYVYCECPSCHGTGLPELFLRRR
jgi:hypothetical protein